MALTKYESYSDDEFLSMVEDKRQHNVIIDELCNRLETKNPPSSQSQIDCPICDASLMVAYDSDNDSFSLEVK